MPEGRLVLVVGPSGAGKDTLMAAAQRRLADDPRIVFARRDITRPEDAGAEAHAPVSPEEFAIRHAAGGYMLDWQAHGLRYGVPAALEADLRAGRTVVVNVSRTVIEAARRRTPLILILNVTAPVDVLAARLAARGREDQADVAERLRRAGEIAVAGRDVVEIANDADLETGVNRFLAALLAP